MSDLVGPPMRQTRCATDNRLKSTTQISGECTCSGHHEAGKQTLERRVARSRVPTFSPHELARIPRCFGGPTSCKWFSHLSDALNFSRGTRVIVTPCLLLLRSSQP